MIKIALFFGLMLSNLGFANEIIDLNKTNEVIACKNHPLGLVFSEDIKNITSNSKTNINWDKNIVLITYAKTSSFIVTVRVPNDQLNLQVINLKTINCNEAKTVTLLKTKNINVTVDSHDNNFPEIVTLKILEDIRDNQERIVIRKNTLVMGEIKDNDIVSHNAETLYNLKIIK